MLVLLTWSADAVIGGALIVHHSMGCKPMPRAEEVKVERAEISRILFCFGPEA